MFGWNYNEKMLKTLMIDHAEDMGRLCAEIMYAAPKAYSDFIVGFAKAIKEQEYVSDNGRRPDQESSHPDGSG